MSEITTTAERCAGTNVAHLDPEERELGQRHGPDTHGDAFLQEQALVHPVRQDDHVVLWAHELAHATVRRHAQVVGDLKHHAGVCQPPGVVTAGLALEERQDFLRQIRLQATRCTESATVGRVVVRAVQVADTTV